jgi:hypothetical protein
MAFRGTDSESLLLSRKVGWLTDMRLSQQCPKWLSQVANGGNQGEYRHAHGHRFIRTHLCYSKRRAQDAARRAYHQ